MKMHRSGHEEEAEASGASFEMTWGCISRMQEEFRVKGRQGPIWEGGIIGQPKREAREEIVVLNNQKENMVKWKVW